jgi:shikimate dehydrogenase
MSKFTPLIPFLDNDLAVFRQPFFADLQPFDYRGRNPILGDIQETRYRADDLDRFDDFTFSGIIGGQGPSDYSGSPALWNAFFQKLVVDSIYFCFDVSTDQDIQAFIRTAQGIPGCLNLNFTDPYKQAAYYFLSQVDGQVELSPQASGLRSVNHMIRDPATGTLHGLNTDGLGLVHSLPDLDGLAGKQVLLLGAGASAASIGLELARRDCRLHIANRTVQKAVDLANLLMSHSAAPVTHGSLDDLDSLLQSQLVIGAITHGPGLRPEQLGQLPEDAVVVDIRYGDKAVLANEAAAAGLVSFTGQAMLLGQFVEAARIVGPMLGRTPDHVEGALAS